MEDFLENFLGADLSAEDAFCPEDMIDLVEENLKYNFREMKKDDINGEKDIWNEDEVKFYELTSQIWGNDDCWWFSYSDCLSCDKKEQIHFFKEVIAYHKLHGIDPLAEKLEMEEFLVTCLRVDSCADNVMRLVEEKFKRDFIEMKEEDKNGEKNK
ncbi:hypothetical protein HS088_TW14G01177 [Tripterygium wilfordii]|uniref:Uncharacterized protein n=1 Tax=Tripterygium wilfordii TaxID=458696 RepID=A0A7J7CSH4_TRIWF|nr:hypothetical protein HS088_TW14G01177 [Tripterygium wilfordii]